MSRIVKNEGKINYNHYNGDDIQNYVIHRFLPFSYNCPQEDNKSKYTGKYIKRQKVHFIKGPVFDNVIETPRNAMVIAIPIENVSQGILLAVPGANMPTTNDANIIFAPSRKKFDIMLNLSLGSIGDKVYYQSMLLSSKCRAGLNLPYCFIKRLLKRGGMS